MAKKEYVRAFGIGEEMFRTMANLAHAVKAQGGKEEDLNLLQDTAVLASVADVLAKAGKMIRPFVVQDRDGKFIKIYLNCMDSTFDTLTDDVKHYHCRLATEHELWLLQEQYPDIFKGHIIVGEQIQINNPRLRSFWESDKTLGWPRQGWELYYNKPSEDHRIAMVFV